MGMFDYIRCDMVLPVEPQPPALTWFQTKFADMPSMDRGYIITPDGFLLLDKRDGAIEVVEHHGDIEFHHFDVKTFEWWSYIARFTEGRCTRICLDDYHVTPRAIASGKVRP